MSLDRREFLKLTGLGLGSLLPVVAVPGVETSHAKLDLAGTSVSEESMGMLYDSTLCVGCKQCQEACKERSDLKLEPDPSGLYEAPDDLSAYTWTMIKLYQDEEDRSNFSFVKVQCMHCAEPACVSACPVGALEKTESGPVLYDPEMCFGCRYCMAACPFNVPKYQWDKVLPLVQKCDFCADRQDEELEPACSTACPQGALIFGKRSALLGIARSRIETKPDLYVNHIYGEHEIGGTSYLYLSHVPFEKLGLPTLDTTALPDLTWPWMAAIPGIVVGVGGLMGGIYWYNQRRSKVVEEE